MSKELRKKAWVALRRRFESAANQYSCLRCVLIHVQEDCRDKLVDPSMLASSSRPYQFWYTSVYSTGRFLYDKEENPKFTDTPTLDAAGKPIMLGGRALAFDPSTLRSQWVAGNVLGHDVFNELAADAGRCVPALPSPTLSQFPANTIGAHDECQRWVWCLFDLAWAPREGSPLLAKRKTWVDNQIYPYDRVQLRLLGSAQE